ncbi:MAG: hypothetical protein ACE5Z5_11230 [Candidatus Bathyarchaeia archaeon]
MVERTYRESKIYAPAEIRKKLGLRPGERLGVTLLDRKSFKEMQRQTAEEILIKAFENPPDVGTPEGLTRREVYEDIR